MTYNLQIVVDCADAHSQADWWAETLGWTLEQTDPEFIKEMIAQGHAREEDTTTHNGMLVWRAGAAISPPEEKDLPDRRRILFQPVPEPKTVKNRLHWDVRLAGDDRDVVRARLEARGAKFLYDAQQGPYSWYTMADPEGNEFCLT